MGITLILPVSVHVFTVLFFQGVRLSHLFTSVGRCWGFDSQRGCAQKETNFQKQSLAKGCRCGWERMKSEGRGHRRTSNFTLEVWSLAPGCQRPVSLKRRHSRSDESLFGVSTAKLLYLKSSSVSCSEQRPSTNFRISREIVTSLGFCISKVVPVERLGRAKQVLESRDRLFGFRADSSLSTAIVQQICVGS